MARVELVHWNPSRRLIRGRWGRLLPLRRKVNNFGDLLGPIIVAKVLQSLGLHPDDAVRDARLLSVGSILSFARAGDTVWGSGVYGRWPAQEHHVAGLDIRAVRGPLTHKFLCDRGAGPPAIFGDPALLLGTLWSREELCQGEPKRALTVIPHLDELSRYRRTEAVVSPRTEVWTCLRKIAASDFVTGSSLHAIIAAEALGIPARLIRSRSEPEFKYADYYQGSGRSRFTPARDVEEACAMGGEPAPDWDAGALLRAFPSDLWGGGPRQAR